MRQTGRNLVNKLTGQIHDFLRDKSDAELRMIRKRVRGLTEINCGWDSYALRSGLREIVASHIEDRTRAKRRGRRKKVAA
jgi:hypothetical protein